MKLHRIVITSLFSVKKLFSHRDAPPKSWKKFTWIRNVLVWSIRSNKNRYEIRTQLMRVLFMLIFRFYYLFRTTFVFVIYVSLVRKCKKSFMLIALRTCFCTDKTIDSYRIFYSLLWGHYSNIIQDLRSWLAKLIK